MLTPTTGHQVLIEPFPARVPLDNAFDQLIAAVRRLAAGSKYVCPTIAERLTIEFSRDDGSKARHTTLSDREYKVFELLVAGKACTQIARELSVSVKTVSTHQARRFRKKNLGNHAELMQYAIANNLVATQTG